MKRAEWKKLDDLTFIMIDWGCYQDFVGHKSGKRLRDRMKRQTRRRIDRWIFSLEEAAA